MSRLPQLQRLHAADPADADIPYMIAQEHLNAGDAPASLEWFDRCLALKPDYFYAYYHKARAMAATGNAAGAAAAAREGLRRARETGNAKAVDELASLLTQLEQ